MGIGQRLSRENIDHGIGTGRTFAVGDHRLADQARHDEPFGFAGCEGAGLDAVGDPPVSGLTCVGLSGTWTICMGLPPASGAGTGVGCGCGVGCGAGALPTIHTSHGDVSLRAAGVLSMLMWA